MKKSLSFLLVAALVFTLQPGALQAASAPEKSADTAGINFQFL